MTEDEYRKKDRIYSLIEMISRAELKEEKEEPEAAGMKILLLSL